MTLIGRYLLVVVLLGVPLSGFAEIVRPGVTDRVSAEVLFADLATADVVFVGESHEKPEHRRLAVAIIRGVQRHSAQLTIGLEMFEHGAQGALDAWLAGELDEEGFREVYAENWSYPWEHYSELLLFARAHNIPLLAINSDRNVIRKVGREGFAALDFDDLLRVPAAISATLNPTYDALMEEFFRPSFEAVTRERNFSYFKQAQGVRNSGMALTIARYLKQHPQRTLISLAGIWHSINSSVPVQLQEGGLTTRVVLPAADGFAANDPRTATEADYLIDDGGL
ncbi:ChaN family lipoprotein [Pelovirga terrestris]|uniref:ChaN family lipoprotein n=1 Tax=Pelovirga terrestris TaxID=2771352 RepID=A0A8J6QR66_9BACT|nr:ChaN family lipoprotein [Pelovirga terrestris]MBD1400673.1 ChaN family lipoprotein [Pelovirga terrestris]